MVHGIRKSMLALYMQCALPHHELHGYVVLVAGPIHLHAGPDGHGRHGDRGDHQVLRPANDVEHTAVLIGDGLKERLCTWSSKTLRCRARPKQGQPPNASAEPMRQCAPEAIPETFGTVPPEAIRETFSTVPPEAIPETFGTVPERQCAPEAIPQRLSAQSLTELARKHPQVMEMWGGEYYGLNTSNTTIFCTCIPMPIQALTVPFKALQPF